MVSGEVHSLCLFFNKDKRQVCLYDRINILQYQINCERGDLMPRSKSWTRIILFLIVLLGVALRAYQVTMRSLWFDEAFSWRLIQFPWVEMLTRASQDVHPPFYYILLKGWRYIFD